MTRKLIYSFFVFLLLTDLCYSFVQHLSQPLDGDLAWNIVPSNDVKPILESPLGTAVFGRDKPYSNPNRFFCHWMIKSYFENVPLELQRIISPIDSIYLSAAIAKIIIQLMLIFLLAMAISGTLNFLRMDFIISAVLVAPLFQTNGYINYMGIIDSTPTYTFFYALPCMLTLLYFMPFILQYYHNKKFSAGWLIHIVWIPFALVISLSGPLNTGIALTFSLLAFISIIRRNFIQTNQHGFFGKLKDSVFLIPRGYWFYLLPISIFSLYSLFIGQYNLNNTTISLAELYSRLPKGIYYQFTQKLGFPLLFLVLAVNTLLISGKFKSLEGEKILTIFKWIGLFTLLYILLLPLGGYRDYRPNVLRYDTIMPVTLSLLFMFGISTLYLIKKMSSRQKTWYVPIMAVILLTYTISDKPEFHKNKCERMALREISESKDKVVEIQGDCTVLSWVKISKPEDSELYSELLTIWRVTKENKLYFNK